MTAFRLDINGKRFGDRPVLEKLTLDVASGEFVALVGPSGCGKTTLLNILAGLECDDSGRFPVRETLGDTRIGYVFQEPRLMPWLTVRDNIELVCRTDTDANRVRGIVERVDLVSHEYDFPLALSGGLQRRVALARAFVDEPDLLLLDEPFVSLDQPSAERLRDVLLGLWREYRPTVLFVTHSLREAIALADRVLFFGTAPGSVLADCPVRLPRPRATTDAEVLDAERRLLRRCPDILSGTLPGAESEAVALEID